MADGADSVLRASPFSMETGLDGTQMGKCSAAASLLNPGTGFVSSAGCQGEPSPTSSCPTAPRAPLPALRGEERFCRECPAQRTPPVLASLERRRALSAWCPSLCFTQHPRAPSTLEQLLCCWWCLGSLHWHHLGAAAGQGCQ